MTEGNLPQKIEIGGLEAQVQCVRMLGSDAKIGFVQCGDSLVLQIPKLSEEELPCKAIRTFEIEC